MNNTDRYGREKLDQFIEWVLEVQSEDRVKLKDEEEADEQLRWFYKVYADLVPDNISPDVFITAWNEYIDKYPTRSKVMFTWDQFFALSREDQSTTIFKWEMEYSGNHSGFAVSYGDTTEEEERMNDLSDIYNWLKFYGSPHNREYDPDSPMIIEYRSTGQIQTCPVCEKKDPSIYGYAFKKWGSISVICPKCGEVGHCYGPSDIHRKSNPEYIKIWPDMSEEKSPTPYIPDDTAWLSLSC